MKSLAGVEKPQPECSCQLCNTLRAHGSDDREFELSDTMPAKQRILTLDELKEQLAGLEVWK
jgi:hypothetical protein